MGNNHVTSLEIDLNAIDYNLEFFKSKLDSTTKILIVSKAFGYGISALKIANHLKEKVAYFAVAYLDEGIALRKAGIKNPILVLHPQISNLSKIIKYNLEPNIYSLKLLKEFVCVIDALKITSYPIHLKFNTGLNRLGFSNSDLPELINLVNKTKKIDVKSVFSHIAASEDLNEKAFTLEQLKSFSEMSSKFTAATKTVPFKHMSNTSGILNFSSNAQFNMVRLGIGLLGFGNEDKYTVQLKNVFQLKSVISQIHTIKKGESVGYNRAFKAISTIKTATIPIGHADGISRRLGNKVGYVYINNKKASIVGNVCMDMIMVDVTKINCEEGDSVVIYKNQQHIEDLASKIGTIPYELLTAISQRVQRVLKKC